VAEQLGPICERVVFLGGASTTLLITDPTAHNIRPTKDVDTIIEITSRTEYYSLEADLRKFGFRDDREVIGRWHINDEIVDIMPTDERILGFSNKWYSPAITHANEYRLPNGLIIRVIAPAYFMATKLEAFYGRGHGDYMGSKDIEDIIMVVDGRPSLVEEVRNSSQALQSYCEEQFQILLGDERFLESIAGHLIPDSASQSRRPIIIDRLKAIANQD